LRDNNIFYINDVYFGTYQKGDFISYTPTGDGQGTKIDSNGHTVASIVPGNTAMSGNYAAYSDKRFFFNQNRFTPTDVYVTCGPVACSGTLYKTDENFDVNDLSGQVVRDTFILEPYETSSISTGSGNGQYYIEATQNIQASIKGDARLLTPLSTSLIGLSIQAYISALYPNTEVTIRMCNGETRTYTCSPNAPIAVKIDPPNATSPVKSLLPSDATIAHYNPRGAALYTATGPISGYYFGDGTGQCGSELMPADFMTYRIGIPQRTQNLLTIGILSGNVTLYNTDGTQIATWQLVRGVKDGSEDPSAYVFADQYKVTTPEDELFPAAYKYDGIVEAGCWLEATCPICVIADINEENSDGDETLLYGVNLEERPVYSNVNGIVRRIDDLFIADESNIVNVDASSATVSGQVTANNLTVKTTAGTADVLVVNDAGMVVSGTIQDNLGAQYATETYVDSSIAAIPDPPVTSVAGRTGAIVLSNSDIAGSAGTSNPTFTGTVTLDTLLLTNQGSAH